jgi:hypothetical protein
MAIFDGGVGLIASPPQALFDPLTRTGHIGENPMKRTAEN